MLAASIARPISGCPAAVAYVKNTSTAQALRNGPRPPFWPSSKITIYGWSTDEKNRCSLRSIALVKTSRLKRARSVRPLVQPSDP
ncbi:hypothetical protein ETD86_35825 [Nonomuraea turkmeniaca]|uniref:Uncharacterized protein n=1 Tax=Nonomuraea turkmeniaca TaxID=103838 RepID=A0A5S4F5D8_9ACTN|nr:hypothetical protein [Nonomuraea turkmeniaca]TMR11439.1 hypothetical protein ETD86_35825 [Nonomuraea turkmeniaca]